LIINNYALKPGLGIEIKINIDINFDYFVIQVLNIDINFDIIEITFLNIDINFDIIEIQLQISILIYIHNRQVVKYT
jgi:hypothetical protein